MIKTTAWIRGRHAVIGVALLAACLLHVSDAGAGKPSNTAPITLTGSGAYVETELFDSVAIQAAVNATFTNYEVDHLDILGGASSISVDGSGGLLVKFEAYDKDDTTTFSDGQGDLTQVFSGIARYDDPTSPSGTLQVQILSRTYWADGASAGTYADAWPDAVRGARVDGIAVAPATAGGLQVDDVIALQWAYDEVDARGELQIVRLARSVTDTDKILMDWPAAGFGTRGQVAVDASGRVYVATGGLAAYSVPKLFRLEAVAGAWQAEDLTPSVGMQEKSPLAVDPADGTVYTVAPDFGDYDAEIWRLDPASDTWVYYARYDQRCCIREYRAMAVDGSGSLHAALGAPRQAGDYIAGVLSGDLVTYSDRIAETSYHGVRGLVADAAGTLFCVHEEKDPNNTSTTTHLAIYRLDVSAGDGGGKGGGKGKNK